MEPLVSCQKTLSHLPERPQVNIEFQDLCFSVPQGRKGSKYILRNINGSFQCGQLTAILGPSGAGKSTLLNVLAGYNCRGATGLVKINGEPRNIRQFRKFSRYIMQVDLLQPLLTVQECMVVAADLKLSRELSQDKKLTAIAEILDMLRLTKVKDTPTDRLSGGEKKRLSIALELVNNPPVIFLDEPTTGLDDMASSQCIQLLKLLAQGGRTVICSIHTPSAKLFAMFDHVYIVAAGLCIYQGIGSEIVPFLSNIGLNCPTHYNPADFIIEVGSGEYGDYLDRLVSVTESNRQAQRQQQQQEERYSTQPSFMNTSSAQLGAITYAPTTREINTKIPKYDSSGWTQFKILCNRMLLQKFRDPKYIMLNVCLYAFVGLMIGVLFLGMGNDGSKTLFNFGFCFTCIIVFMYCPLLPVLLNFPFEVQLLKREYFNRWYNLPAYFFAMTVVNMPIQFVLGMIYCSLVYVLTDQPLEAHRIAMFITVCYMIALISEAIGMAISSTLNILNGMFLGSAIVAPTMVMAVYDYGTGRAKKSIIEYILINSSYLRHGLQGVIFSVYGDNRGRIPCPEEATYCMYSEPKVIMADMGMEHVYFWTDFTILIVIFVLVKMLSYFLLKQRLEPNQIFTNMHKIADFVKSHFNDTRTM